MAYLADLPVSEVKIDRSFVSRMATGSGERIIVNSSIDLAHHLGLRAIAEGVDDLSLLPQLTRLGCDAAQGYAISRPLAGADFIRWLTHFDVADLAAPLPAREPDAASALGMTVSDPTPCPATRAAMMPITAVGQAA